MPHEFPSYNDFYVCGIFILEFYNFYMAVVVDIVSRHAIRIKMCRGI